MAYKPQKSIEEHVSQIVTALLEDDLEHDARHIVDTVMSIVPDHRIGSTTNRSVAAAAVWCTSRVCSLYREDGIPSWTQCDIAKASGVCETTIRNISRRMQGVADEREL